MRPKAAAIRIAAILLLGLGAACTSMYRHHGYIPPDEDLAQIDVGATRDEVELAVGPPSTTGLLTDEGWFYVKSWYRDYAWRAPVEIDREVVAISFQGDTVSNIERFGLEEGRVVVLSRRVTDRNVAGISLLQQVFGNLANFDPTRFIGEE